MMDANQAKALLERYRAGKCSPEEQLLVEQWYDQMVETGEWHWSEDEKQAVAARMEAHLLSQIMPKQSTPVIQGHFLRRALWWAAASFLLLLGAGIYFLSTKNGYKPRIASVSSQMANDILPAKQQVVLTLADGSTRVLDSVSNGAVANTEAIKKDNSISYLKSNTTESTINAIQTGRGRTFSLQLPDGSNVWVDALSSIRFPTAFSGTERLVEITGQAYFEVVRNPNQPFKVKSGGQVIEVLGTNFNVNSYDTRLVQTTLLEGSVRVKAGNGKGVLIKPGEQVVNHSGEALTVDHSVNIDEVMAWKNGRFQFSESSIEEIMNQLSHWYDIDVVYKDKIRETFVADINRDLPLSKLLTLLEMTKQVKFSIEGNKITVMKY
ncbi:FecR family protein [Chitinophaga ginsengisegetis]|uniref:FecR family protein n=1 Tax=Chitinophaga ginsengisegetis TaxID=393003 RepID=A0A1T5NKF9_9BACT|nr:FecR family protein [Chitinophaga ginsengisegetis]SKD00885.1 FecR family protein [Chitinophaga ginsengisegetis]